METVANSTTPSIQLEKKFQSPKRKLPLVPQSVKKTNHGVLTTVPAKILEDFQNYVEASRRLAISPMTFEDHFAGTPAPSDTSGEDSISTGPTKAQFGALNFTPKPTSWPTNSAPFKKSHEESIRSCVTDHTSPLSGSSFSSFTMQTSEHMPSSSSRREEGQFVDNDALGQGRSHWFVNSRRHSIEAGFDDPHNSSGESADNSFCDEATAGTSDQCTPPHSSAAAQCFVDGSGVTGRMSDLHVSRRNKHGMSQQSTPQLFRQQVSTSSALFHKESPHRLTLLTTESPDNSPIASRSDEAASPIAGEEVGFRPPSFDLGPEILFGGEDHDLDQDKDGMPADWLNSSSHSSDGVWSGRPTRLFAGHGHGHGQGGQEFQDDFQLSGSDEDEDDDESRDIDNGEGGGGSDDEGGVGERRRTDFRTKRRGHGSRNIAAMAPVTSPMRSPITKADSHQHQHQLQHQGQGQVLGHALVHPESSPERPSHMGMGMGMGMGASRASHNNNNNSRAHVREALFFSPAAKVASTLFWKEGERTDTMSYSPDLGTPVPNAESPVDIDADYALDIEDPADDEDGQENGGGRHRRGGYSGRSLLLSPVRESLRSSGQALRHLNDEFSDPCPPPQSMYKHATASATAASASMSASASGPNIQMQLFGMNHEDGEQHSGILNALETSDCSSISDMSLSGSINRSTMKMDSPMSMSRLVHGGAGAAGGAGGEVEGYHHVEGGARVNSSTTSFGDSSVGSHRSGASGGLGLGGGFGAVTGGSIGFANKSLDADRSHGNNNSSSSSGSSNNNSSSAYLPMPDQSAFDRGVNSSRSSDGSSPVCPPTPVRTPIWVHDTDDTPSSAYKSMGVGGLSFSDMSGSGHSHSHSHSGGLGLGLGLGGGICPPVGPTHLVRQNSLVASKVLLEDDEHSTGNSHASDEVEVCFSRDFVVDGVLGAGSFGEVVRARDLLRGGQTVAVKKSNRQFRSKKDREFLMKEVRIMKLLGKTPCQYIIHLVKAWQEGGYFFVEIDYADKGTVGDMLALLNRRGEMMPDSTILQIVHNVASGLAHIHAAGLVHMDIKPANLLIASPGVVKIADFGMTVYEGLGEDGQEGDSRYMAPELLDSLNRRPTADVFSFGITIFELCVHHQPKYQHHHHHHHSHHHHNQGHSQQSAAAGATPSGTSTAAISTSTTATTTAAATTTTSLGPPGLDHSRGIVTLGKSNKQHHVLPLDGPLWHELRVAGPATQTERSELLQSIVSSCMSPDPSLRPSVLELLQLPEVVTAGSKVDRLIEQFQPVVSIPLGRSASHTESNRPPVVINLTPLVIPNIGVPVVGGPSAALSTPTGGFEQLFNFWLPDNINAPLSARENNTTPVNH